MNINFKIDTRQKLKQKLKLSQNMKMSLEILKMPLDELNKYIKKEISNNFSIDINFRSRNLFEDNYISELDNLSDEKDFFNILEEQLSYLKIDKKIREICIFIINNLNRKGYLEISKFEIKSTLKINSRDLEEAFEIIYNLEPYGIGAYSLEECLKIQLKAKDIVDNKLFLFIDKYLYLLAEKNYKELIFKLKISEKQLYDYIKIIKSLNPIPSRGYNVGKTRVIIPDAFIEVKNGEIFYKMNKDAIPQINFDEKNNNFKKINEIITCIEKRFQTLDKIMKIVLREQKSFFLNEGKKYGSLKIINVASELNLNPSTVSRAIKEKYIKTNFGIVSLKKLFTLNSSTLLVYNMITEYIKNEDKKKPYSDQDIENKLQQNGIKIARRTVAKYRKELGYKPCSKRKIE